MMGLLAALLFIPLPHVSAQTYGPTLEQLSRIAEPKPGTIPIIQAAGPVRAADEQPCLYDGKTGQPVPAQAAFERAARSQVVYAGEQHDQRAHHQIQLWLLNLLTQAAPSAAAGFEMLFVTHQAVLDRYLAGEMTDEEFRSVVDWKNTWGFPFDLYKPLFDSLRAGSRRGAALNVPKAIVHKVAVLGLESLTPEERRFVPPDFQATDDPAYLDMLRDAFKSHGGDPADRAAFGRYVDAMSLWNEGMAYNLAVYARANPDATVLVIAGAFHAYKAGIPSGIARRISGVAQTSFILVDARACPARIPSSAITLDSDYLWVVPSAR